LDLLEAKRVGKDKRNRRTEHQKRTSLSLARGGTSRKKINAKQTGKQTQRTQTKNTILYTKYFGLDSLGGFLTLFYTSPFTFFQKNRQPTFLAFQIADYQLVKPTSGCHTPLTANS